MWRSFDWREHALALRAGLLASLLELLLRVSTLQRCQALLRRLGRAGRTETGTDAGRLAAIVCFGARYYAPFPPACLARSLALQHLLGRRGISTDLCLGTRLVAGDFSAHAWVEYRGAPLAESQAPRENYVTFRQ